MGRAQPEAQIQTAIIQWARWHEHLYPSLRWLHAIPNGGSRNKIEAKNLKMQGVVPGIYDLFLPAARRGYHGFYLEIKSGKNDRTSNQCMFGAYLDTERFLQRVYWDAVVAEDDLAWYLNINKEEGGAQ